MSLRVWLPLNGNLNNQGLSDITVTNSGATVDNNGKIGKCYYFDGNAHYLQFSKSVGDLYSGDFSYAVWLKPMDDTRSVICSEYASSGASNIAFELSASRQVRLYWDGSPDISSTGCILPKSQWTHIVITRSGNEAKFYMNGELKYTYTGTLSNKTSTAKIRLGDDYRGGTSVSYMGYMNDFRLYDHALFPKEVEVLSRGLVCHYPLEGANDTLLPFGYQQLEYIESSGSSAFDTKYKFNPEIDSLKMVFKGNDVTNNGMLFGRSAGNYFWLYYYGSNGVRVYAHNGSSQEGIFGISSDLVKHTAEFKNKHYIIDGVDKGVLSNTYTESAYSNWMFSYGSTQYCFKGRIYYAQIGRNGKVQRTFIPAKRLSDSKIGMYELNTNEFFPSGTSTDFTAGDVVGTPTTIYDCSGYKNNGTINGSLTTSNDTARYSMSTHIPSNGYIQHPNALGSDTMKQEWTCCAWVKLDSTVAAQQLNNFNSGNNIVHSANSTPLLYLNGGTHDYYRYGSAAIQANVWTHIAFVFKNSTGLRNVYINGELKNGSGPNKDSTPAGIPSMVTIFGGNFNGYVSDYREYATALSATQVAELYNTAISVANNGTLMDYELVEV